MSLLVAAGCSRNAPLTPALAAQSTAASNPGLKSIKPEKKSIALIVEQPGFLEAFEEAPLFARIPGYVSKVHFDIGERVAGPKSEMDAGPSLAELSVPEMVEEHRQKQALVVRAEAAVEQTKATIEAADAQVATAKARVLEAEAGKARVQANFDRWQSEFRRIEELVKQKVIDAQTQDETRNQFRAAEAARQEVDAKVISMQALVRESMAQKVKAVADLAAAEAQVLVAKAEEGRAAALLQYRFLKAPFAGVITKRNVSIGHFVQPPSGPTAAPLFVVARTDIVRVFVDVPENEAAFIAKDQPVSVRIQALGNRDFPGSVTRDSWSLDPRSRTLRVEVDLDNKDGILRPGMYAHVQLKAEFKDRWVVPPSAIGTVGASPCCWILEGGKFKRVPVRIGLRQPNQVELLEKQMGGNWQPLNGDESFLVGDLADLKEGAAK